ncbi:hypothetical protein GcM1_127010, partial [Golovinomyces cichoracearum]
MSISSALPEMPTQTISAFTQNIFRKYGLSEIALTHIDEMKLGKSVIDLEDTTKAELASTIKDLKRTLLERGIFVPLKGYADSIALEMVISEEEPHVWTTEEIAAALKRKINYHPKISIFENRHSSHTSLKIEKNKNQNLGQKPARYNIKQLSEPPNNPLLMQESLSTPFQSIGPQSFQYDNQNMTLPPIPVQTEPIDPDIIVKFVKCFDNKKRYTREPYDILEDKTRIFLALAQNMKIRPSQFHAVFPRILTERAEWYFINHMHPCEMFSTMYTQLKQHFDTE